MLNLAVTIFNPAGILFELKSSLIVLPAVDGEIGVLYDHIPLITSLKFGLIKSFTENKKPINSFFVNGGIAKIDKHKIDIICDECIEYANLDKSNIVEKINLLKNNDADLDYKLYFYKQILTFIS